MSTLYAETGTLEIIAHCKKDFEISFERTIGAEPISTNLMSKLFSIP